MYPNIPYEGLSWPITQHAGVLKAEVFDGLLNACLLCKGEAIDAKKINGHLVDNGILTANVRADSNQVDAWRDYQQDKQGAYAHTYSNGLFEQEPFIFGIDYRATTKVSIPKWP